MDLINQQKQTQHIICLVEDDDSIRELLVFNLESEGHDVRPFSRGQHLLDSLASLPEDQFISLFILDIMLPDMDGYEILRHLRKDPRFDLSSFLMLTALSAERNKLRGFDEGADDYMTKPFGMGELIARTNTLLARGDQRLVLAGRAGQADTADRRKAIEELIVRHGDIVVNETRRRVWFNGTETDTTRMEYNLLIFFLEHPGFVFSRDHLLSRVWGYDYEGESRTVDVHIHSLRKKLEESGLSPDLIETVHGVGYRLREAGHA
ncbi:MAG TPA: response regulator transcription factor [Bacillota bacterium]|nr:response regulator transcription factor [Bacillota bacterium]